ncbi:MAG: hypothetical protein V1910_02520 [bacterium]
MKTIAFIDASNLFYGGEKSLGWKIDYQKLLKYLREIKKKVLILSRGSRTAKEIRQFAGSDFMDFVYLRELIKIQEK